MSFDLPVSGDPISEARRQIEICNACRYCEGYCAVFPAITRQRSFADGDITQLANLCHNCRGCYYACQYTAPHEFDLNLPQILANVSQESWQRFAWPSAFAGAFQRSGLAIAGALVICLAVFFGIIATSELGNGNGFYSYLTHAAMVAIFAPAFMFPFVAIGVGLRRYWHETGGQRVTLAHLGSAIAAAATARNLGGGQGQGCNFEQGDRYSTARQRAHQATMYGFLLCFASTATGTIVHYGFGIEAPYPLASLPKLFGISGGLLLVAGTLWMASLKAKADPRLGASAMKGGEMAFILLLGLTGLTGLILYAASGSLLVGPLLALHLSTVLAFFLTTPYSKMAHGFYRLAALTREAQLQSERQSRKP